ncbi:hypothetical protein D3C77_286090 [compost metagenome]
MGDEDEGNAQLALQFFQLALHLFAQLQIEGTQGFVEQQYPWSIDQCTGQGHALALAAGQLHRLALAVTAQGNHGQGFLGAGHAFLLGDALDLQAIGDVVANVHVREQGVILEHRVDVTLIGREAGGLGTVDADGACAGLLEACDQAQAGGLA